MSMNEIAEDIKNVLDKHGVLELKMKDDPKIGYVGEEFHFNGVRVVLNKPDWYVKQKYNGRD
ncbi:hypothetical protein [Halobacillus karajensis]|uniref:Uncharacterized protein n=1 Tax=Halobacillus karajensis TaxID=195088 RepID=A0A059NW64_9BACI|nr:hypothetical protein [Halobacillus karajensis]CDQ22555.1 hypothetical protein BN983_00768 [Halobacillus karajensis]CDQ26037.1 hypothetical protein BN981_00248 [Halobacillus karajensis]